MIPSVSVIVPVYNVEKYLSACLDSLVNQTLQDIEIIVINDGSPDHSQGIIDSYVADYPGKVFGFIKENGGLSDARNYGLKKARGKYIGFIDSDDTVELDMYQSMLEAAETSHCELVVCDLEYVWENSNRKMKMSGYVPKLDRPMEKAIFLAPLFAWNKLYLKSLFENNHLSYPKGLWYEDIPVTVPFFALAKKICHVEKIMVHYLQRSTSIMGSKNNPKMNDIFTVLQFVNQFYKDNGFFETYRDELEYLYIEHLMLFGSFRFLRSSDYKKLMKKAFNEIDTTFKDWHKNPYIKTLKPSYRLYLRLINPFTVELIKPIIERKRNDA